MSPTGTCTCLHADNLLIHKSSDTLTALNVSDNSNETLISSSEWAELVEQLGGPISKVVLSHDREWALLITNVTSVSQGGVSQGGEDKSK